MLGALQKRVAEEPVADEIGRNPEEREREEGAKGKSAHLGRIISLPSSHCRLNGVLCLPPVVCDFGEVEREAVADDDVQRRRRGVPRPVHAPGHSVCRPWQRWRFGECRSLF